MRAILLTLLVPTLAIAVVPLSSPALAQCVPQSDPNAVPTSGPVYIRFGQDSRGVWVNPWIEENDIPGLQLNSTMACGAAPDRQGPTVCTSRLHGWCVIPPL